jgi:hypothetical protein
MQTPSQENKQHNKTQSKQGISIEDAQQLESFRNWNEEQLSELVLTIKTFCRISYSIWSESNTQKTRAA